ncbi:ABC transporter ATP-binding protein [bacterium]|nr:ABC transporter ATP-binding protein [bacterium]
MFLKRAVLSGFKSFCDRVEFDFGPGTTCIVGPNGCGKTTTLKMINRLVEPTSGSVAIDKQDIATQDAVQLRRRIGYVFQGIGLFPHLSVAQNVAAVPALLGWQRAEIDARVDEMLELVGLPPKEFGKRKPNQLSGGQQQRVGFARALAARQKIMLMDEPFGALDPITRDGLQRELKDLQRRLKLTAILVTHDMAEALLLGDRIAVMRAGGLLRVGTPRELMQDAGHDYVRMLLQAPLRQAQGLDAIAGESHDTSGDEVV